MGEIKILSTKLLEPSEVNKIKSIGFEVKCMPFISTQYCSSEHKNSVSYDLIVFTSLNAINYYFNNYPKLPVSIKIACLSGKSNKKLRSLGYNPFIICDKSETLAEKLNIKYTNKSINILHPCGNRSLDTLSEKLNTQTFNYKKVIVYNTKLTPHLINIEEYQAVFFYSPSGIESFSKKNILNSNLKYVCIGDTSTSYLRNKNSQLNIITSTKPSPLEMAESLKQCIYD